MEAARTAAKEVQAAPARQVAETAGWAAPAGEAVTSAEEEGEVAAESEEAVSVVAEKMAAAAAGTAVVAACLEALVAAAAAWAAEMRTHSPPPAEWAALAAARAR